MTVRRGLPIGLGAAASLLLHAVLLAVPAWPVPEWHALPAPPPIEARLVDPAPPRSAALPSRTPRAAPRAPPVPSTEPADEAPTVVDEPEPEPETIAAADSPTDPGLDAESLSPPEPEPEPRAVEAAPEPEAVAAHSLNPLPARIDLQYRVRIGPASGRQDVVWISEGGRYTLTSVTAATGFASLVYSGRLVQTSRGRIDAQGLVPEEFWDQRGDRRASARIDPERGALTLVPAKGELRHFSYEGKLQDALSLLFQLALTAPPEPGPLAYTVFNGKKLRDYVYEVRGEETLETAIGALRTLHLARLMDGGDRFEVWLAVDRHYLPVRVLRVDDGIEGELAISSIGVFD